MLCYFIQSWLFTTEFFQVYNTYLNNFFHYDSKDISSYTFIKPKACLELQTKCRVGQSKQIFNTYRFNIVFLNLHYLHVNGNRRKK